ncbi:keratin, type II cytoskeletal 7-like isoform X1 [Ranitomeya variabilis]|uniref:keratin, type II cytoskeletal 7-like isoform X1 n=1 Tax=Ranitomeya variabilis TaxID=490064 RepID=UPI0040562709
MKIIILFVLSSLSLRAAESEDEFLKDVLEVGSLEQKKKVLETKWTLLQEQREQIKRARPQTGSLEPIFEQYINNLRRRLDELLRNRISLRYDFKSRNEHDIHKRAASEIELVDKTNAFSADVGLEIKVEFLTDEINFLRRLYDMELTVLKASNSDTSKKSGAEAASVYQDKIKELQASADQQGDALLSSKKEISKLNRKLQKHQAEIEDVKNQIFVAEAQDMDVVALKGALANLAELDAAQQNNKRELARRRTDYEELLKVKITLEIDIDLYKYLAQEEKIRTF